MMCFGIKSPPKFLIQIDGKPMVEHVVNMFDYTDTFHFVVNEDQINAHPVLSKLLKDLSSNTTLTVIESHEIGPTYSALQVAGISNEDEVIVSYCDFFVNWNYQLFKRTISGYAGAIPSFRGFHPASFGDTYYAYMRLNSNDEMLELREKKSFTSERYNEHASVGIYYFANTTEEKTSIETASVTSSKSSILVAPIKASGLPADQEAFGTGITESMISILSQYKAIRVLSSNTSFHVAKTEMLDAEIRDQYGVDYLIRGSIQVMGNNARLNIEITDLKLEEVSVSKKRDFNLNDIFKVQDDLSNEILSELQINMGVGSRQGKRWASNWKSIEDFTKFLNWRNELRTFTKESHLNSQRMLDELKDLYPEESDLMYVAEAWTVWQRILMQISTDKEKDLERLNFVTNKAIELNPESADAYAARALIGLTLLNTGCEAALTNVIKSEESGSTADTLQIGGRVYARCGDLNKAIRSTRNALKLVPNDTGWFITGALVNNLYLTGQIEEIYKLIGKNIEAKDMDQNVLAIYAFLEHKKGNKELAEEYLSRAKNNGFSRVRLERFILNKELRDKTIKGLLEIGSLE